MRQGEWESEMGIRRKNIACSFMALRGHGLLRLLIPPFPIDPFTACVFSFEVTSDRLSVTRRAGVQEYVDTYVPYVASADRRWIYADSPDSGD